MFTKVAYNGIAVVITTIAAILASMILARTLGPEAWGIYAQANWIITLGANLVSSGLILTAIRFLGTYSLDDNASERASIMSWLVIAQIVLIIPGCLLLLLYSPEVNRLGTPLVVATFDVPRYTKRHHDGGPGGASAPAQPSLNAMPMDPWG